MSTTNLPHYNSLFAQPFHQAGLRVIYQPSCLINAYDGVCWPIKFPAVDNWKNTVVIMHCQDFVSVKNGSCPELELIEQHFGANANRVIVVHWNINLKSIYTGPLHLVYFPTHSYELLLLIRDLSDEWKPNYKNNSTRAKRFQCLNGVPRSHRQLVVNWLDKNNIQGIVSFGTERPLVDYEYTNFVIGFSNQGNWMVLQPIYTQCDVNIVTETMYYECPGIISEKTLMAILAMQIPIIIGYKGIVKHLEDLGFDVFRDIVNTEYDDFSDNIRWLTALESNRRLFTDPVPRKQLEERLVANREHALSTWLEQLIDNYNLFANHIIQENFLNLSKD